MAEQKNPTPDVNKTAVRGRTEPAGDFQAFVDELRWQKGIEQPKDATKAASVVLCELERRLTGPHRDTIAARLPEPLRALLASCQRTDGSHSNLWRRPV